MSRALNALAERQALPREHAGRRCLRGAVRRAWRSLPRRCGGHRGRRSRRAPAICEAHRMCHSLRERETKRVTRKQPTRGGRSMVGRREGGRRRTAGQTVSAVAAPRTSASVERGGGKRYCSSSVMHAAPIVARYQRHAYVGVAVWQRERRGAPVRARGDGASCKDGATSACHGVRSHGRKLPNRVH